RGVPDPGLHDHGAGGRHPARRRREDHPDPRVQRRFLSMPGKMVEFPSNGTKTSAYLATPAAGKGPGVLVIQEWWGLVRHIKTVCDRLATEGFTALAPDMYHGKTASEPDAAGKLFMALNIAQAAKETDAAIKKAGKQSEIHIYPGVDHAFFNDERPEAYNNAGAADAWKRTLALFRQHLK